MILHPDRVLLDRAVVVELEMVVVVVGIFVVVVDDVLAIEMVGQVMSGPGFLVVGIPSSAPRSGPRASRQVSRLPRGPST
jgi:hypothetical protein